MKASINGPNRRKNRAGDKTFACDFTTALGEGNSAQDENDQSPTIQFKVKSLEKYLASSNNDILKGDDCNRESLREEIGDACLFSVRSNVNESNCAGQQLIRQHFQMGEFSTFFFLESA